MKTYFHTFGCKVNQYETELLRETFVRWGARPCAVFGRADAAVINTCAVTRGAEKKCRNLISRIRRENPRCRIIVTGCYSQADSRALKRLFPGIAVFGNRTKQRPAVIWRALAGRKPPTRPLRAISRLAGRTRAFIKVQDGCDNFCSYCIIPFVRPKMTCRSASDVLAEARALIAAGTRELVLCGIRLGRYADTRASIGGLTELVRRVTGLPGDFRVRLSSIEPMDFDDDLAGLMLSTEKLCRHLHLPLQSGDNRVLAAMNRPYTREQFIALAGRLRRRVPGVALTTDVIVGFPGEDAQAFANTCDAVKQCGFSRAHIFTYSPRPGTKAALMKSCSSAQDIACRRKELESVTEECARAYMGSQMSTQQRVLPESDGTGLTDTYIRVRVGKHRRDNAFMYGTLLMPGRAEVPTLRVRREWHYGKDILSSCCHPGE